MNCLWMLFCVLFPPVFYPLSFYFKQITCVSCLKVFFFFAKQKVGNPPFSFLKDWSHKEWRSEERGRPSPLRKDRDVSDHGGNRGCQFCQQNCPAPIPW